MVAQPFLPPAIELAIHQHHLGAPADGEGLVQILPSPSQPLQEGASVMGGFEGT